MSQTKPASEEILLFATLQTDQQAGARPCEEDQHEGRQLCAAREPAGVPEGHAAVRRARGRALCARRSLRGAQRQGRRQESRVSRAPGRNGAFI